MPPLSMNGSWRAHFDQLSEKEQLWIQADEAWLSGDLDMLRLYYLHFTRLYPDDASGWFYLGLAEHWKLANPAAAVVAYDRALEINPDAYPIIKAKVDALEAAGNKDRARAELERYLKKYPKSYHSDAARGRLGQIR